MYVGPTLPVEIRADTDIVLEYDCHWALKLFADRLPIAHPCLLEKILKDGSDPNTSLLRREGALVHQYRADPPGFMISPAFREVEELVRKLDLPTNPAEVYFSKIWTVEEFAGLTNSNYPEYEKYSIETFGVRVIVVPDYYPVHLVPSVPNPFNLPRYWLTPSLELIQIRRVRVFNCSIKRWLKNQVNDPVTRNEESVLYLEERWHPTYWDRTTLGGLAGKNAAASYKVEKCFRTARRILSGNIKRGRPQGTKRYPEGREFYEIVRTRYFEMQERNGSPPSEKEVIDSLRMSKSGYEIYWRSTERSWPPIHPHSHGTP